MSENRVYELSSLRLLRLTGADRQAFLHGQLTRDMNRLDPGQAGLAAWCNPKGRVIATFVVVCADDHIDLLVAADLKDAVIKRLRMFVLRAQVDIEDVEAAAFMGLAGTQALAAAALSDADWSVRLDDARTCIRLPGDRTLVYGDAQDLHALRPEDAAVARDDDWTLRNIETRQPWIDAAVSEQFLPQMLNLDLNGGLDFNKGCYPGQEVVARLHYRGEVKQRLHHGSSDTALTAGEALYSATGERAGHVVNAAANGDGGYRCLAVTNIDSGRLHIGGNDGPAVDIMP
ncbi:folate-binding protein YgfZ [Methylohalomonas lacus]|uniref:Folate-binding protein YgfZ n=1 Tax=Methylohalomonas lacus TaxID=398773 RepID=A0AAE3HID3_9GAMM|nr:folate-binding protein [Methylohalomonas lacus]MCS3902420.1 folate-binding protein YgfZ [Methylohalomonas lacus]